MFQKSWRLSFHGKLKRLGFRTYNDYLASDHWRAFRERYRASAGPQTCLVCGSTSVTLHHISYDRMGAERLTDVVPLCWPHHEAVHAFLDSKGLGLLATSYAVRYLKQREEEQARQDAARRAQRASGGQPGARKTYPADSRSCDPVPLRAFSSRSCNICSSVDQVTPVQLPLPREPSADTGRRYICWRCALAYVELLEAKRIDLPGLETREQMWQALIAWVVAVRKTEG